MRKRLITREKINQRLNEKENKQRSADQTVPGDKEHAGLRCEPVLNGGLGSCLSDLNSNLNNLNKSGPGGEEPANSDPPNNKSNLTGQLHSDSMETHSAQSNHETLKQKLVSLNNSKFVIEEDVENEALASPILNDEFDDSEYDYDGEDLSENDENYYANGLFVFVLCWPEDFSGLFKRLIALSIPLDYPDDHEYNVLDYYRYRDNDDDEREMLEKFESWANDGSDHYSDEDY